MVFIIFIFKHFITEIKHYQHTVGPSNEGHGLISHLSCSRFSYSTGTPVLIDIYWYTLTVNYWNHFFHLTKPVPLSHWLKECKSPNVEYLTSDNLHLQCSVVLHVFCKCFKVFKVKTKLIIVLDYTIQFFQIIYTY